MFNSFNYSPDASNENSISKYGMLGPAGMGNSSLMGNDNTDTGFNFSDILKTQMIPHQVIGNRLDTILLRLENEQPLVNVSPEDAAKEIFESINLILNGVHDLLNQMSLGKGFDPTDLQQPGSKHINELDRLIEGAKTLFIEHENPAMLEELSELWQKLKKSNSPLFNSIHNFFISIALSFSTEATDNYEDINYSQTTQDLLHDIISSMEPCEEQQELELILDLATTESTEIETLPSESEQLNFFN